jgi:hypothetical protein
MNSSIQGWSERTVHLGFEPRTPMSVTFMGAEGEMIRIARDGFYVRGERIPEQSADEARRVYRAFLAWLRAQGMAV